MISAEQRAYNRVGRDSLTVGYVICMVFVGYDLGSKAE